MPSSRRSFAKSIAAASLVKPLSTFARQETPGRTPAEAQEKNAEWHAQCFDDHELETVAAVAELIIPKGDTPGAREASVPQHLDTLLAVGPERKRTSFLEGLWWLDGYCLRVFARPFTKLSSDTQRSVLTRLIDTSDSELQPGRAFVTDIKHWTARIYYSTQAGQQELNKGGRVPAAYAGGCSL